MTAPPWVKRLVPASLPLVLSPVLFYLLAEDYLSFGGGEKDIILVLPYSLWAVLFLAASLVGWRQGRSIGRSLGWAALFATVTLLAIGLALAFGLPALLGVQ